MRIQIKPHKKFAAVIWWKKPYINGLSGSAAKKKLGLMKMAGS